MKTIELYAIVAAGLLLCTSCNNGRWECTANGASKVVCINNNDTISYYVQTFLQQNIEAKEYYENNGYVCFESPYPDGAPTNLEIGHFSRAKVKELESMGYDCKSIGP